MHDTYSERELKEKEGERTEKKEETKEEKRSMYKEKKVMKKRGGRETREKNVTNYFVPVWHDLTVQ